MRARSFAVGVVLAVGLGACGSSGKQTTTSPAATVRNAAAQHVRAINPNILSLTKIKVACAGATCTAKFVLPLPGMSSSLPLARDDWNATGSKVRPMSHHIDRYARIDARRDCVGHAVDAISSGSPSDEVQRIELALAPCS